MGEAWPINVADLPKPFPTSMFTGSPSRSPGTLQKQHALTYTDVLVRVHGLCLTEFPSSDHSFTVGSINIGLVVDVGEDVRIPV